MPIIFSLFLTARSPGQVVGLVEAQLLSTMCVVQGMMGTSLLWKERHV